MELDKSKWPPGPWHDEPDELDFTTQAGYTGRIRRGRMGALCGYVLVPDTHPMYKVGYDDVPVQVHGGLTYSEGRFSEWILGFDCAHAGDVSPHMLQFIPADPHEHYRDIAYVTAEVESLAIQLLKIQKGAK